MVKKKQLAIGNKLIGIGKVITDLSTAYDSINATLIQKDGKIIVARRLQSKTVFNARFIAAS